MLGTKRDRSCLKLSRTLSNTGHPVPQSVVVVEAEVVAPRSTAQLLPTPLTDVTNTAQHQSPPAKGPRYYRDLICPRLSTPLTPVARYQSLSSEGQLLSRYLDDPMQEHRDFQIPFCRQSPPPITTPANTPIAFEHQPSPRNPLDNPDGWEGADLGPWLDSDQRDDRWHFAITNDSIASIHTHTWCNRRRRILTEDEDVTTRIALARLAAGMTGGPSIAVPTSSQDSTAGDLLRVLRGGRAPLAPSKNTGFGTVSRRSHQYQILKHRNAKIKSEPRTPKTVKGGISQGKKGKKGGGRLKKDRTRTRSRFCYLQDIRKNSR